MDGHNGGMAIMVAIMLATMMEWNRETPIWGGGGGILLLHHDTGQGSMSAVPDLLK